MIKIICRFIICSMCFVSVFTNAEQVSGNYALLTIPYDVNIKEHGSDVSINDKDITILATKGTDLFTNADGSNSADNAPRVFFEPKGDFTFSAKVTATFTNAYDGGALFIYGDSEHWAKLLFERFKSGDNGIASTVTKETGDDTYHNLVNNNETYLRVMRKKDTFIFFYSNDGEQWVYRRSFNLKSSLPIKVGVVAQSPISATHKVVYSEIQFQE